MVAGVEWPVFVPLFFAPSLALSRPLVPTRLTLPPIMQLAPGGDLEGGRDEVRNADVLALKNIFYKQNEENDPDAGAAAIALSLGVHLDLPLTRWSMVIMPHQQTVLNVFQPEYVHMFETLLTTPEPWLYFHVQLPGGLDNLANPAYALPDQLGDGEAAGAEASITGTVMRVVAARREADARLSLIVQGLARGVVLGATQALPFARANVQALPDAEALADAARSSRQWLVSHEAAAADQLRPSLYARLRWRMLAAAAAAEERCWRPYEFKDVELRSRQPPAFAAFEPAAVRACAELARASLDEVLPLQVESITESGLDAPRWYEDGPGAVFAALSTAIAADETVAMDAVQEAWSVSALEAADAAEAVEIEEQVAQLAALETQVWLELDAFLRAVAVRRSGGMPVPSQLLSLLPPPPAAGWPDEFVLMSVGKQLGADAEAQRAMDNFDPADDPEPFVPVHADYPARRRAQRFSYSIWAMIREENADLQAVLEANATSDRLRMALLRLREIRGYVSKQ